MSEHLALARRAAQEWGFAEPVLVRVGMNSLFNAGDDVVLRVSRSTLPAVAAEDAFLASVSARDVRVPRRIADTEAPNGLLVTAMERIHPEGVVDWREVGAMVRRVHGIDPADVPGLPWCGDFPHWQFAALMDEVRDAIDGAALAGLGAAAERAAGWAERARPTAVVCHGDVHPGNVLPTAEGPVLLDWDLRCLGPVAWDHGPLMTWSERWGGAPGIYEAFADGYGTSLRGDWMGERLAELRNVAATLMRVKAGRTDPAAAAEAERRLRFWRGDPDAPQWTAM
jgi:aminoglycoside phosphotransferase (APT) family kinase protein